MKTKQRIMITVLVMVAIILTGSAIGYGVALLENLDMNNITIDNNPSIDDPFKDEPPEDNDYNVTIEDPSYSNSEPVSGIYTGTMSLILEKNDYWIKDTYGVYFDNHEELYLPEYVLDFDTPEEFKVDGLRVHVNITVHREWIGPDVICYRWRRLSTVSD